MTKLPNVYMNDFCLISCCHYREEQEKLNIWVALLNLENLYGTEESLLKVFERALQQCEPLKVFQNLVNIYSRTGKLEVSMYLCLPESGQHLLPHR